jgi:hypothetical protein
MLLGHFHPFRIESWEVLPGDFGRESQAHRPLLGIGREQVPVQQVTQNPPGRALRASGDARRLPAGEVVLYLTIRVCSTT